MPSCPYCGHDVIEGEDACPECQQSLSDLHLPTPASPIERALLSDRVSVLEPKTPLAATSDSTVGDVLQQMVDKGVGCMLVIDDGTLQGIFSERDALLKLGAEIESCRHRPVSEYMTRSPKTLEELAKVAFAVQRMDLGGFRHLPTTDADGATTGMVSVRDVLRYLTDRLHGE